MTYREALALLDQATATMTSDRKGHLAVIEAVRLLDGLVTETEAKAAIAADIAKQSEKPTA